MAQLCTSKKLIENVKPKNKSEIQACLQNHMPDPLHYLNDKEYRGHANFPSQLPSFGNLAYFSSEQPVKATVLYKGLNQNGVQCAWLLAFSAIGAGKEIKVYVEAGKKTNYDNVDWDDILGKLNDADAKSSYEDGATGCKIEATIDICPCTNGVRLAATFGENA